MPTHGGGMEIFMFDLTGKTALITGSSQGIGLQIAKTLADYGAKIYVHASKSMEKAEKAAKSIKRSTAVTADLSKSQSAEQLYAQTSDVDILILNASVQYRNAWENITEKEFDTQCTVNFKSSLLLMQKYIPHMKKQNWGRIITIGSVQQYRPHKDMAVYAASKAAQMSLVTNLSKQLAPCGITVNNVSPGVILTPRNEVALSDVQYAKNVLSSIPAGRFGIPADCSGSVLLLCSSAGSYITGNDIIIDGGMRL